MRSSKNADLKGWRVDQRCHQGIDRRQFERQRSGRRAGVTDRNHICPGGLHRYGWSRQIEVLQEKLLYLKPDWAQRSEGAHRTAKLADQDASATGQEPLPLTVDLICQRRVTKLMKRSTLLRR